MTKIFLIGDTHFGHTNIIKYKNRPFKSTKEMDAHMLNQWNKVVSKDDIVFHLGDFALGLSDTEYASLINRLNGKIYLIQGNHDRKGKNKLRKLGFADVFNKIIVNDYILTHRPQQELGDGEINIHGHTHTTQMYNGQYINVSVEAIDYTPVDIDELLLYKRQMQRQFETKN